MCLRFHNVDYRRDFRKGKPFLRSQADFLLEPQHEDSHASTSLTNLLPADQFAEAPPAVGAVTAGVSGWVVGCAASPEPLCSGRVTVPLRKPCSQVPLS